MFINKFNRCSTKLIMTSARNILPALAMGAIGARGMSTHHGNDLTYTITSDEFKEIIDNYHPGDKVIFLDVREDEDCADGFLPVYNEEGVKLDNFRIPILDLIEMQLQAIEPYKDTHEILCYCRSGNKSVTATRLLNLHGFNALNVKGGMKNIKKVMDLWKQGKFLTSLSGHEKPNREISLAFTRTFESGQPVGFTIRNVSNFKFLPIAYPTKLNTKHFWFIGTDSETKRNEEAESFFSTISNSTNYKF